MFAAWQAALLRSVISVSCNLNITLITTSRFLHALLPWMERKSCLHQESEDQFKFQALLMSVYVGEEQYALK